MAEKVGARLRLHNLHSKLYRPQNGAGWLATKVKSDYPTDDGRVIYELGRDFMTKHWSGQQVRQVQVTLLNPIPDKQIDFWITPIK